MLVRGQEEKKNTGPLCQALENLKYIAHVFQHQYERNEALAVNSDQRHRLHERSMPEICLYTETHGF